MKVETIEWIGKAEGDIRTSQREFSVNEHPNYDAVCFHAQQCAEKYLKAQLEALKKERIGQHSMRINDQYRICFVWAEEGSERVEISDYH